MRDKNTDLTVCFVQPHRGAVRKDGAEIPRGWSLPERFTSSGGF